MNHQSWTLNLGQSRFKAPFSPRTMIWKTRNHEHDLSSRAMIMGILNVTPDSFSDGGKHISPDAAVNQAMRMIAEGADIIDIGGESTRPGAEPVPAGDEIARVSPVIKALRAEWDGLISIDTMKPQVAEAALKGGVDIVNDVTGLRDPAMIRLCSEYQCGVVAMHMLGEPRTMQNNPDYHDVVAELREFFEERHHTLTDAGIAPEAICFDPGIGFGKTMDHNIALLRGIADLEVHQRPIMIGLSRKSFIGKLMESDDMADRYWPTVALTAWTRESGARIHRVHDVKPNYEAVRMVEAIMHQDVSKTQACSSAAVTE